MPTPVSAHSDLAVQPIELDRVCDQVWEHLFEAETAPADKDIVDVIPDQTNSPETSFGLHSRKYRVQNTPHGDLLRLAWVRLKLQIGESQEV